MNNGTITINAITVLFLLIWGAYERISAIRKERKNPVTENRDSHSLIIFYSTILLGYGVGIPVSFTGYGIITAAFPFISAIGFILITSGLTIRLMAIRTLAEHFAALYRISIEEKVLINHFSGQYKEYMKHTRLLIPWIY